MNPVRNFTNGDDKQMKNPSRISNGVNKKIYLDYAASTPVAPEAIKETTFALIKYFGNTMSLYSFGQEAKRALEESRKAVAGLIGANPSEIIFTSSATESNNLALKGISLRYAQGKLFQGSGNRGHIIISRIEHLCVMESAKWLEGRGFEVTRLPVNKYGLVNPEDVKKAIKKTTILVSIIHASNEIGTIQPIKKIGEAIRKKSKVLNLRHKIYFHTDAAQSFGKIEIDVNHLGVDLLTASSHKTYGPKGAACLFIRKGTRIEPILHGGGQEFMMRSSTVNVPAIVGFAKACLICKKEIKEEGLRQAKLRDKLIRGVLQKIEKSHLNGHPKTRLVNNTNFWFEFVEGESIVIQLDLMGVAASTGSACSSEKLEPSHVLLAIGLRPEQAHGSLRLTLGRWTKESDINYVLKVLPGIIKNLRKISPFKGNKKHE